MQRVVGQAEEPIEGDGLRTATVLEVETSDLRLPRSYRENELMPLLEGDKESARAAVGKRL